MFLKINILLLLLLILSIIVLAYLLIKIKQQLVVFKDKNRQLQSDNEELANNLKEEKQINSMHREELLSQTEHMQALNVELEKLSLVASKTDTAVAIADHRGRFEYVNKGFVSLFGFNLEELSKEIGDDIYKVSKKLRFLPKLEFAIQYHKSLYHTSLVLTKSGEKKWVKTSLTPIFDENNRIIQYVILNTDVTELKRANDELRKLSLVASKTDNVVIIFDKNGKIDWVNDSFQKMYGYSYDEYLNTIGDNITDFYSDINGHKILDKLTNTKKPVNFIKSIVDKSGIIKWKQSTVTPVLDDKNEITNFIIVESDITRIKEAEQKLQEEKNKADLLLLNILPEETAEELKTKGKATPRFYRSASVLFADIQNFTKLAENLTPEELVQNLQTYFIEFDNIVIKHFIEKIKTIGDAYLCVGGIPMKNKSHAFDTVLVALELQQMIKTLGKENKKEGGKILQFRIGIHTGPIVAGVVGKQKMTYDIWGDTVNIAKRIESACIPGMVNISTSTYEIIKDFFECESRGKVLAKHKGHINMYFVNRIKPEFSEDASGFIPNKYFKEMLAQL
jgi:PAS domain S-box-containing protein